MILWRFPPLFSAPNIYITSIQKALAKIVEFDEGENRRAEVTGDGKVNINGATAIQKHIAGIETGYPIGEPMA